MTRHWSWETSPDYYPRLFGEVAAALADRINAPHVLFAASAVDDEDLEQELRSAGLLVQLPKRKKRWIVTSSHGSLDAWRVVRRDEASETPEPLWRGITSVYAYPAERAGGMESWSDVEAPMAQQQPHLISHDADCVTAEAPLSLEEELMAEASAAAQRVGGRIKEL